jgi:hypothetical protein
MPPVDRKGAAAPEQKPGEIPPDGVTRASAPVALAAVGGARAERGDSNEERAEGEERAENDATDRTHSERPRGPSTLDAAEADRYAAAFRPSWAPLAGGPGEHAENAAKHTQRGAHRPVRAEPTPRGVTLDEPLTVPGLNQRRRVAMSASLSIVAFLALTYWGVSSATKTPHQTTELTAHGKTPSQPAGSAREPTPTVDPAQTASAAVPAQTTLGAGSAVPSADEPRTELAAAIPASAVHPTIEPQPPTQPEPASEPAAAPTHAAASLPAEPAKPESEPAELAKTAAPALAAKTTPVAAAPAKTAPVAAAVPAKAAPVAAVPAKTSSLRNVPPPAAALNATRAATPANAEPNPLHPRNPLLTVRGVPETARLWLDGQRMANPFDIRLPRGIKHRIEARADGYESSAQFVKLDSDVKLTIAIRRSPPPARARGIVAAPPPAPRSVAAAPPPAPRRLAAAPPPAPRSEPARPVDKHRRGAGFVSVSPY